MSDDSNKKDALPEPSPIEHGGRVELRLTETDDGSTKYAARWFTSEERIEGQVEIATPENAVQISSPDNLPAWLGSFTTNLVRTTARKAQKEGTWPRRLTRWRKAPEREQSES